MMRSVLFVAILSQAVLCQYDDLSILEEVLTRTSQRPVIRQLPSEATVPSSTVSPSTEAPTSSSTVTEEVAISTSTAGELVPETTPPSTPEEVIASSSTPIAPEATTTPFPLEESTDETEMLFMGMKRPDLATIYRRLFPF